MPRSLLVPHEASCVLSPVHTTVDPSLLASLARSLTPVRPSLSLHSIGPRYLPLTYGQILLFLKLELQWGVRPSDCCTVSNPDQNRFRRCPPVLLRLAFRSTVVALYGRSQPSAPRIAS